MQPKLECQQSAFGLIYYGPDPFLDLLKDICLAVNPSDVDAGHSPACLVQSEALHLFHLAIPHIDENRPLGTTFSNPSPLQIARKHNPRITANFFVFVDVPERPVLIIASG
jgi:hypothetical protein